MQKREIDSALILGDIIVGYSHFDGPQGTLAEAIASIPDNTSRAEAIGMIATYFEQSSVEYGLGSLEEGLPPNITHTIHVVDFDMAHPTTVHLLKADTQEKIVSFGVNDFLARFDLD